MIVIEAVSRYGDDFQYASMDLRADPEIALVATKTSGGRALTFAKPELLAVREFGLKLVKVRGDLLSYLAEFLRADPEIVNAAVNGCARALQFAAEELLEDQAIVDLAVERGFKLRMAADRRFGRYGDPNGLSSRKTVVLSILRQDRNEIKWVSPRLRSDRWFAMELLQQDPWYLQHLSGAVRADHEVIAVALGNGFTLQGAPQKLKTNPDIVYLTVQRRGVELKHASEELRGNRKIVSAAMKNCGMALQYAAFQLRNERNIVEVAIKQDLSALKYAGAHLRNAEWAF